MSADPKKVHADIDADREDGPRDVPRALIRLIEDEGLRVGDRLPPELELVRRLGFGRSTIRETLKTWESMGSSAGTKGPAPA